MPGLTGVNHLRAIKALEKAGFWIAREGKHVTMTNGERVITIPRAEALASSLKYFINRENQSGEFGFVLSVAQRSCIMWL